MSNLAIQWRPYTDNDLAGLPTLAEACDKADGEDSVPIPGGGIYAEANGHTHCAVLPDGQLVAVGSVILSGDTIVMRGKVHPGFRQHGLGSDLLRWQEAHAREFNHTAALVIRNEAFTTQAAAFYSKHGYASALIENWMHRNLSEPIPNNQEHRLKFRQTSWNTENAVQFFEAYHASFRDRPGFPDPAAEEWLSDYTEDEEFRPDLSLLIYDQETPIGFITTGVLHFPARQVGWVLQIGVLPAYRGQRIAAALIVQILHSYQVEGFEYVQLHVNVNNPPAIRVYERLGFRVAGQRAKYVSNAP